jgi:hypothetical protein
MRSRFLIMLFLAVVAMASSASSALGDTQYQMATSGTLTMSSPAWEYIGQGRIWDFEMPAFQFLTIGDPCDCFVGARVQNFDTAQPEDFQWSFLYFQTPAGQVLTAGTTYTDSRRWPFQQPSEPGLDVGITGRGCNESAGEFTVLDVAFAPNGDVRRFHATFKQYCEFGSVPLQGEINIANIPPPQTTTISIDSNGSVTRQPAMAQVHGIVTCAVPGPAKISGTVTQGKAFSKFDEIYVDCSDTPVVWTATVASTSARAFSTGSATVKAEAEAQDPNYSDADGNPLLTKSERTSLVELTR